MSKQHYRLRSQVFVALKHMFSADGDAFIFTATVQPGEEYDRLVITEDYKGVLDNITRRGLVTVPEEFSSTEASYEFWDEVLSRVEVEWDHAMLSAGSKIRLSFPDADGSLVQLCDWEIPKRFEPSFDREWILEPQPA